jgi:hypothetical protein
MIYRMSNQLIWVWLEGLGNPLLLRLAALERKRSLLGWLFLSPVCNLGRFYSPRRHDPKLSL